MMLSELHRRSGEMLAKEGDMDIRFFDQEGGCRYYCIPEYLYTINRDNQKYFCLSATNPADLGFRTLSLVKNE